MPELPEVETVRKTLEGMIVGKTIASIDVYYGKIIHNLSVPAFILRLQGQTLQSMGRYGKYLFFQFDRDTLISHLRMEGRYFLKPASEDIEKHEHIVFHFTDDTTLRYQDVRKFGTMELVPVGTERQHASILAMGPEPADPRLDGAYLERMVGRAKRPIKSALLDQSVVTGLGNIYVDEVLFLAKLHPQTVCSTLSITDFQNIAMASREVIQQAILLGGTTIRTYLSSLGVSGRFQNQLNVHMQKGKPCAVCQTTILKIKVGGRGTYYCPHCQPLRG